MPDAHAAGLRALPPRHATPRELINRLRDEHRILWETDDYSGGHWLLFRQDDIDHVLKTPELFTNSQSPILDDFPLQILAEQQQSMTFMGPPEHRKYRSLVDYAFRLKALESRKPVMRRTTRAAPLRSLAVAGPRTSRTCARCSRAAASIA